MTAPGNQPPGKWVKFAPGAWERRPRAEPQGRASASGGHIRCPDPVSRLGEATQGDLEPTKPTLRGAAALRKAPAGTGPSEPRLPTVGTGEAGRASQEVLNND
jgi:hypothetical protein